MTTATDIETDTTARRRTEVEDPYLPLRTLAAYSGLSVRTLRSHLNNATHPLPFYRIGGKVLVRRSEYDAWASRFRATAAPTMGQIVENVMRGLV